MFVNAKLRNLRIAPRKVRLVVDLVRGKKVSEAQAILKFVAKKGAEPVFKLLNSAVANAKNNFQIDSENLFISKITVDEGPKLKRWMPRARGSASEIQKKSSHITLVLEEIKGLGEVKKARKTPVVKKVEKEEEKKIVSEEKRKIDFEKPKMKPIIERESKIKPQKVTGIRRIFRRKSV